jgi:hypothetical protein
MGYEFNVKSYQRTDKGVILQVFVPDTKILNEMFRFNSQIQTASGELKFDDGRHISAKQKKRIYLTIKDIANHLGYFESEMEQILVENFNITEDENLTNIPSTSMHTARKFIAYLLELVLSMDIPLSDYALNRIDDLDNYLNLTVLFKRCSLCGRPSDIHHAEGSRIGMGSNRNEVIQVGRKVVSLCRVHHEILHNMSEEDFFKKYKIHPVVLTEEMVKKLNL